MGGSEGQKCHQESVKGTLRSREDGGRDYTRGPSDFIADGILF